MSLPLVRFTDVIGHESFFLDFARGNNVLHPYFTVTLMNGATLVTGKYGLAVDVHRGGYLDLDDHETHCMGNLALCKHGMTFTLLLKPRALKNGDHFLSSPSYSLYYSDGKLVCSFVGMGKNWTVSSPKFFKGRWQRVTVSWHPSKGLKMFIDDRLVDTSPGDVMLQGDEPKGGHVFVGKAMDSGSTASVLVDEIQYWYDDIDQLRATKQYGGKHD